MSEPKRAPCIDIRTDVRKDERFVVLAELAGLKNRQEALGCMFDLWAWCRDRGLQDTREGIDGYVVAAPVVRRFLGPNGTIAILGGEYGDDFALAVELEDGMLYLRGTSEYVAAARAHKATAKAGGEARARQAAERGERSSVGRYVSEPTNVQPELQQETSSSPAGRPAAIQPAPASSSYLFPLPSSQIGDPEKNSAGPSVSGPRSAPKPKEKPGKPTEDELASIRIVLDKLSVHNGVQYSGTEAHKRLIVKHLRDGIPEIDLRAVIGYCAVELGWKDKPEMAKYLRPETLFGPQTFSKYLDPARSWFNKLPKDRQPARGAEEPRAFQGATA